MFAPAKLNLFLHVGERRSGLRHEMMSLVAFADIGDVLDVKAAPELSLEIEGPFAKGLSAGEENLVMRAARALATVAGERGARMTLTKNLPLASGLGGGSSDAAAALRALNLLWNLDLGEGELSEIGFALGADVPVCLYGRTAFMSGAGEQVAPGPEIAPVSIALVNPGVAVATVDVFGAIETRSGAQPVEFPSAFASAGELAAALNGTANDLQAPATSLAPEIADVLAALERDPNCLLARMSGSGATCIGIFADDRAAASAAHAIRARHPAWWVMPARLCDQYARSTQKSARSESARE